MRAQVLHFCVAFVWTVLVRVRGRGWLSGWTRLLSRLVARLGGSPLLAVLSHELIQELAFSPVEDVRIHFTQAPRDTRRDSTTTRYAITFGEKRLCRKSILRHSILSLVCYGTNLSYVLA